MIQLAGSSGVGTDMVLSILVKVGAVRVPFAAKHTRMTCLIRVVQDYSMY